MSEIQVNSLAKGVMVEGLPNPSAIYINPVTKKPWTSVLEFLDNAEENLIDIVPYMTIRVGQPGNSKEYYNPNGGNNFIENSNGAVVNDEFASIRVFNKILCIGDSWTQGVFDYDEEGSWRGMALTQYSYPTVLASLTGKATTNKGDAGRTSVQWFEEHGSENFKGHDACIIFLGINDISSALTSAEKTTAFTNIINKVKADNDNIKIFIVKMPKYLSNSSLAMDNLIESVAYTNGCYTVDIADVDIPRSEYHPLAIGYEILAKMLYNRISKIIQDNIDDFKDIFTKNSTTNSTTDNSDNSILLTSAFTANQISCSEIDLEANPHGYIDKDTLEFVGNNNFLTSGFVYIKGVSKINFKLRSDGVSIPMLFYDKNKQLLPELTLEAERKAWEESLDLTLEKYKDAYYLVVSTWNIAYPPYLKLQGKFNFENCIFSDTIERKCENNLFDYKKSIPGYHIWANGSVASGNSLVTDFIKIPDGASTIYFKGLPTYESEEYRFGCWFAEDKTTVILAFYIDVSLANDFKTIPANAKYFKFSIIQQGNVLPQLNDASNVMVSVSDIPFEPYRNYITSIAGESTGIEDLLNRIKALENA